jgi:hypothetical protein
LSGGLGECYSILNHVSLIRLKRINEFNVEATLALFLPYHESPHFAKMVTILHIQCVMAFDFFTLLFVEYFL